MIAPQELDPIQLHKELKEMFSSEYSIFGPLTGLNESQVRALLQNFDVHGCPDAYFDRMARKCKDKEVSFLARHLHGEIKLVKDQRTLSFPVACDVPGKGRLWLLEYVMKDGVWVLRKYPDPSETYALHEKDIRQVLHRALTEEFGICVAKEHVTDEYLIRFEGPLQLMLDQLEVDEEDLHPVEWSSNFFVRNRVHRCGWKMPLQYLNQEGYIDTGTNHWFRWHGSDGKLVHF